MIRTTHGLMDEKTLLRTVLFEDRPKEFVVAVEWQMEVPTDHKAGCPTCSEATNPEPKDGKVLVRRDAHVILKEPSVVADAIVASLG